MLKGSPIASPRASPLGASAFCRTALPASWQAAFRQGTVPHATGESTGVVSVDPLAAKAFANEYTSTWNGVVEVRADGSRRRIFQYRKPDTQQLLSAAFDGRWLLFGVGYQLTLSPDWTLHVWDSQTGVQRKIAQGTGGGILIQAVAGSGFGAWSQTVQGRVTALHLYSFAQGADHVVSTDIQGWPFYLGPLFGSNPLLLWPAAPVDGSARLRAVDVHSLRPVTLPAVLNDLRGAPYVAAGPGAVAWVEKSVHRLWAWRSGWPAPRLVAEASTGEVEWPVVAGDLVGYIADSDAWVADLRSGSRTRVTPYWGSPVAAGHTLAVAYPESRDKAHHPLLHSVIVDATRLSALPGCGTG